MTELAEMQARAAEAFQRRRYDLAAGLYRQLVDREPRCAVHHQRLASALQRLGCRVMAADSFRSAAELFREAGEQASALSACRAARVLQPSDARLRQLYDSLTLIPRPTAASVEQDLRT